jgi:hypothetical protein
MKNFDRTEEKESGRVAFFRPRRDDEIALEWAEDVKIRTGVK